MTGVVVRETQYKTHTIHDVGMNSIHCCEIYSPALRRDVFARKLRKRYMKEKGLQKH
jgi:hypothetical protein